MPDARRILVDTNVLLYMAADTERGRRYARHLVHAVPVAPFIAVAEVLLNARKARDRAAAHAYWCDYFRWIATVWPDPGTCAVWAETSAATRAAGRPYQDNDLWIAACALQHDLPLMTHNAEHFEHIEGLRLIHEPDPAP